jgi:hypothetical protein
MKHSPDKRNVILHSLKNRWKVKNVSEQNTVREDVSVPKGNISSMNTYTPEGLALKWSWT